MLCVNVDPPVVGIDPGETVGVAVLTGSPLVWELHQLKWVEDLDALKAVLSGAHTVVYEGFRQFPNANLTGARFTPVEVIGFLRGWAADTNTLLVEQPASIKQVLPNAELFRLLGYRLKGGRHALDAVRHLVYYLAMKGLSDEPPSVSGSRCTLPLNTAGSPLVRRGRSRQNHPSGCSN